MNFNFVFYNFKRDKFQFDGFSFFKKKNNQFDLIQFHRIKHTGLLCMYIDHCTECLNRCTKG